MRETLNNLNSPVNNNNFMNADWRRSKVMELSSQGYSQSDIAKVFLHFPNCTSVAILSKHIYEELRGYDY